MSKQPTKPQPKQSPPSQPRPVEPRHIPLKKDTPSPNAPNWGGNPPIKK
jgi:hypothetical protein